MLNILDRYIIKKYLGTFFFASFLITLASIVIDFSDKINKFIDQDLSVKQILFDYYINFIPWINGLLWPLFALISVVFFTSRMARNTEIIPMLGSGISFNRLVVPYLISSSIIAAALWYGTNYLIPKSTKHKNEFEAEYIQRSKKKNLANNIHFFVSPQSKIFIKYYKTRDSTAQNFRLENYDSLGILNDLIIADKIAFKEEPDVWTLKNYIKRGFNELDESIVLGEKSELDTALNFKPSDFVHYTKQMEMMTTKELKEYISVERSRGLDNTKKYEIELQRRTADPFTIIIMTLIGMAVASKKVRGGMGLHLAVGVIIGSAYVVLSKFSKTFAENLSVSAEVGMWAPNIFFGLIALVLIYKAQK